VRGRHKLGLNRYTCLVDRCTFQATRKDNLRQHHRRLHPSIPYLKRILPDGPRRLYHAEDEHIPNVVSTQFQSCNPKNDEQFLDRELFFQAASAGHIDIMEAQLDSKIDVNFRADDGSSALHCAARSGCAHMVEYLIRRGADLEPKNCKGRSPLHEALLSQDLATIQQLHCEGAELDTLAITVKTLGQLESADTLKLCLDHLADKIEPTTMYDMLVHASMGGHYRAVQTLLLLLATELSIADETNHPSRCAKWRVCSQRRDLASMSGQYLGFPTPLHAAAGKGHLDIVKLLVKSGCAVNKTALGETPLYRAVAGGYHDVVEYLLGLPDIDLQIPSNRTTLLNIAALNGRVKVIEVLLAHTKLDIYAPDRVGRTPLHMAAVSGKQEVVILLLKRYSSKFRCVDRQGHTPLRLAVFAGHWETAQALLTHEEVGSLQATISEAPQQGTIDTITFWRQLVEHTDFKDINVSDDSYSVPRGEGGLLNATIRVRRCDFLQFLLSQENIDVNLESGYYDHKATPLVLAAELGQIEIVKLLLQHKNIDIDKKVKGYSALQMANIKGHSDIFELLLLHSAEKRTVTKTMSMDTEPNKSKGLENSMCTNSTLKTTLFF
jgi:ankyrin repeat protein